MLIGLDVPGMSQKHLVQEISCKMMFLLLSCNFVLHKILQVINYTSNWLSASCYVRAVSTYINVTCIVYEVEMLVILRFEKCVNDVMYCG